MSDDSTSEQSVMEIRNRMQRLRRDIDSEAEEVVGTAKSLMDWKVQFKQHPWAFMIGAAAAGAVAVPRKRKVTASNPPVTTPATGGIVRLAGQLLTSVALRVVSTKIADKFLLDDTNNQPPQVTQNPSNGLHQNSKHE